MPLNSLERIADDMRLPHEGQPHGVPLSYDWAESPRIGMGNDSEGFQAFTAWGQVYEDAAGNPATNTRVQLRNIRAFILSKRDGRWHEVQRDLTVDGAAYREDFAGDASRPADIRVEPDGGISVTAGDGFNFHFWPTTGRASLDPSDIAGVVTSVDARLVVDDSALPDDRRQARYLLSVGADYWLDLTAEWDNFRTNGDVAIGRFRYVQREWQSFNMTTLSLEELERSPPPLE